MASLRNSVVGLIITVVLVQHRQATDVDALPYRSLNTPTSTVSKAPAAMVPAPVTSTPVRLIEPAPTTDDSTIPPTASGDFGRPPPSTPTPSATKNPTTPSPFTTHPTSLPGPTSTLKPTILGDFTRYPTSSVPAYSSLFQLLLHGTGSDTLLKQPATSTGKISDMPSLSPADVKSDQPSMASSRIGQSSDLASATHSPSKAIVPMLPPILSTGSIPLPPILSTDSMPSDQADIGGVTKPNASPMQSSGGNTAGISVLTITVPAKTAPPAMIPAPVMTKPMEPVPIAVANGDFIMPPSSTPTSLTKPSPTAPIGVTKHPTSSPVPTSTFSPTIVGDFNRFPTSSPPPSYGSLHSTGLDTQLNQPGTLTSELSDMPSLAPPAETKSDHPSMTPSTLVQSLRSELLTSASKDAMGISNPTEVKYLKSMSKVLP